MHVLVVLRLTGQHVCSSQYPIINGANRQVDSSKVRSGDLCQLKVRRKHHSLSWLEPNHEKILCHTACWLTVFYHQVFKYNIKYEEIVYL